MTYRTALTTSWSAFAAEVATNRALADRLMHLCALAVDDNVPHDVREIETRVVLDLLSTEIRIREDEEKSK